MSYVDLIMCEGGCRQVSYVNLIKCDVCEAEAILPVHGWTCIIVQSVSVTETRRQHRADICPAADCRSQTVAMLAKKISE